MAQIRDYYDLLGVSRTASTEEIRKAYRRLAREHHPDLSQSPDAAQRFAEITEAYEVLTDPERRRAYDRFGHAASRTEGAGAGPGGFNWSTGPGGAAVDAEHLGSIFEEMFGQRGSSPFGGGGRRASTRPTRPGPDLRHTLTVSFMTAAKGGEEQLRTTSAEGGSQTVAVKIPPGIESGSKLRIKGHGQPGPGGGPAGDLILTVEVGKHPFFRREGLDVLVDVPITIIEAALGTSIIVPLLQGTAEIRIPAGASSGQKLRIRGQGTTDPQGRVGDFYAVVQIVAPDSLSPAARTALEQVARELKNPRERGPWADLNQRPDE